MLDEDYRVTRRREWDEAGKRYDGLAGGPLADLMRQATDEILKSAELQPGEVVLDVGTGPGSPALEIVPHVGAEGKVVGIDSAPSMIAAARRRAAEAGLANAQFVEMEAEKLEFADASFDAVVSRYGFPHFTSAPVALSEAFRVLRPGGRLAAAMHGAVGRNPYFTAPVLALQQFHTDPVPVTDRGPFFFHRPNLFERALRTAGFSSVACRAFNTSITVEDFEAYWAAQKAGGATVRRALDAVPADRREDAETAARNALKPFVKGNNAVFPAQIIIGSGTKP